jgi:hypothetical protein
LPFNRFYHRPLPDVSDGFWVKSPAVTLAATAEEVAAEPAFAAQAQATAQAARPGYTGDGDASAPPPLLVGAAQAVVSVAVW